MPTLPDHYRALQVLPDAEHEVVRAAYRALAAKYHPDVAGGSPRRMSALNAAWAVLRNPKTRSVYDGKRRAALARARERAAQPRQAPQQPQVVRRPTVHARDGSAVLDFGRYADWSVRELARHDPDYLEWLIRTPTGRRYRGEVEAALAIHTPAAADEPAKRSRFSRF